MPDWHISLFSLLTVQLPVRDKLVGSIPGTNDEIDIFTVGIETQVVLVPRKGGSFGLAFMAGYGLSDWFVDAEEPDEIEFGPVAEFANHKWLLTLNPRLVDQDGEFAEQEGFGFEYGWQAKYDVSKRLSLALEMFGEVEDMANAGPFDEQEHSIGPAFYYTFEQDWEEDGKQKSRELVLSLGAQFGLTDATSDMALKVFISYEYF